MLKISEEEIRKRLQEWRNYKQVLYPLLKERSSRLRKANKALKKDNERLEKENKYIQKILLELEEMREIVYGKKQKNHYAKKVTVSMKDSTKGEPSRKERTAESYRKKEPEQAEITGEILLEISTCPACGGALTQRKEHIHYREDLEGLDVLLQQAKKVTKRIIESGYCDQCKKRKSAVSIPKQKVEIGRNVKATIVYLHVLLGLSYEEVKGYLKIQYNMDMGDGMIARSLEEQSDLLRPFYQEHIYQALLNEQGNHYDESSWKVQGESEGNYVWVKTGMESNNVLFWFGRSRGKGVAERLRGDMQEGNVANQVGVSDDYGSYRNLFAHHQLCWAHPQRKLRDLAESTTLKESIRKHCEKTYIQYARAYKKAEKVKRIFDAGTYTEVERQQVEENLIADLLAVTIPHEKDPDKLRRIKESLRDRKEKYVTFLHVKDTPLDNNKAERALRRIVLKRKKSFGSKSQKGANVLSILYSVVFSIYFQRPPEEFFEHYHSALGLDPPL